MEVYDRGTSISKQSECFAGIGRLCQPLNRLAGQPRFFLTSSLLSALYRQVTRACANWLTDPLMLSLRAGIGVGWPSICAVAPTSGLPVQRPSSVLEASRAVVVSISQHQRV